MTKVTAITVFPYVGLLGFLLSPNTQIKLCFTPKMLDCRLNLLFLPRGRMLPEWWVVCRVGAHGHCARAVQKRPPHTWSGRGESHWGMLWMWLVPTVSWMSQGRVLPGGT